jgi:YVTN family beta-propeller protein
MKHRRLAGVILAAALCGTTPARLPAQPASAKAPAPAPRRPGLGASDTLLPNGWRIAPAGRHLQVGDLPLSMVQSPDGRYLIVENNGYAKPTLTVVDLKRFVVLDRVPLDSAWLGLAWHPDGKRVYASAGSANSVYELSWRPGTQLKVEATIPISEKKAGTFTGGLAIHPDGKRLYAVNPLGQSLAEVDLATRGVVKTVPLDAEPYTCLVSRDGRTLYVSSWGGARVLLFDPETLEPRGEVATGEHPSAMAESPDGARLFVACANTNAVWAVDVASRTAAEQIGTSLFPQAPPGSTPNAVALSADGRVLLVANADNNTVSVVDVSRPGHSAPLGTIPTGWYPTGAAFSTDGKRILVLSGKGLTSQANPRAPQPGDPGDAEYVAAILTGTLSVLDVPDPKALAAYTQTAHRLSAYTDAHRLTPDRAPKDSAIPARVGAASPIKHVFYIVRENRTYDQILGDMKAGNGDASLCLFGENVTPNAHALAREFVLLDNFYVDAEVSADGHAFSTAAYAPDSIEKLWPQNYGRGDGRFLTEGGGPNRNAYGNIAAPMNGYIWDQAKRAGVSVRSYGEFAVPQTEAAGGHPGPGPYDGSVPGLHGHVAPDYPPWDLSVPDARRVDAWLSEFRRFEKDGNLPRLSIIRLPNDHTSGTKPGFPTPTAMIAENDAALGRIVEAISKSRYWKDSAVFVLEDDAQDGPDHVDAHRSVAFVASPYARRGAVDSTLYTTSAMLRTIELILGLAPMSQYDAAASPMYGAFRATPDPRPFAAIPPRVSIDEKNDAEAWGAQESAAMDLGEADRAPDRELNEIIWRSVRGSRSPMPPPLRAAFVRPSRGDEVEEDEREDR